MERDRGVESNCHGDEKEGLRERHSDTLISMSNLVMTYLTQWWEKETEEVRTADSNRQ